MRVLYPLLTAALACSAAAQSPALNAQQREALIQRMRQAALSYGDRLRDFTCIQKMTRSAGPSATGKQWKLLETQETELTYANRRENYRLLKVNGQTTGLEERIKKGYFKPSGEFGTALAYIFAPSAKAQFEWDRMDTSSGQRQCVFRYTVPLATSTIVLNVNLDRVQMGHHGFVHADCETGSVTRLNIETDVGRANVQGHKVKVGRRLDVRYGPVTIGEVEFLLPQTAVDSALYYKTWTKAEIDFQQYRKYEASSTVKFDESLPK